MQLRFKSFLPFVLLLTSATSAWPIEVNSVTVNVEAMIGEATLVQERVDGKEDTIVVPTGQTTHKDPTTGKTSLTPSTIPNRVNEVVRAIAASEPDANNRQPTDEGCSKGDKPQRLVPQPEHDEARAAAIAKKLEEMSPGELMMVMAVMISNAGHLCINSSTVANTVTLIATVRPEAAANVVFVAALLDHEHADRYAEAARNAAPDQAKYIDKALDKASEISKGTGTPTSTPPPVNPPPIEPERDIPPGGAIGEPPSPE